ncbi:MAG: two-component system phosphate regulon response regulator PhoB [Oleiphilaceae bacterium]
MKAMPPKRNIILIINNEPYLGESITFALESAGFEWIRTNNTDEACSIILLRKPQLILLDWVVSGTTSIDFIKNLKQDKRSCHTPILMLTSKKESGQLLLGLQAGADDCMTKPFSYRELIARLKAILRRATPSLAL